MLTMVAFNQSTVKLTGKEKNNVYHLCLLIIRSEDDCVTSYTPLCHSATGLLPEKSCWPLSIARAIINRKMRNELRA